MGKIGNIRLGRSEIGRGRPISSPPSLFDTFGACLNFLRPYVKLAVTNLISNLDKQSNEKADKAQNEVRTRLNHLITFGMQFTKPEEFIKNVRFTFKIN